MYELAAGPVQQADREREVTADLRSRQLLADRDATRAPGQPSNEPASASALAPRRSRLGVRPLVER